MIDPPISRGFRARRWSDGPAGRVPPGQHVTTDFPVLSAGPTPEADLQRWTFGLHDRASRLAQWSWAEFEALPQTTVKVDIHCVTTWSKLDTTWQGVTIDDLLRAAGLSEAPAPFAMIHCEGGYTTNLPAEDLVEGKAMVATRYEGEPLAAVRSPVEYLGCDNARFLRPRSSGHERVQYQPERHQSDHRHREDVERRRHTDQPQPHARQ